MKQYDTINEVIEDITPAFGEFIDDFDIEGIAREIADWQDGRLVADPDRDDFWEIAARYER